MSLHQSNPNKLPDSMYNKGSLKYLVKGNSCVLLDGRRTPGIIENIHMDAGMFIWRITDFEDKGKFWELPFEDIVKFQFLDHEKSNQDDEVELYRKIIKSKQVPLHIRIKKKQQKETQRSINEIKKSIHEWLNKNSKFFQTNQPLILEDKKGSNLLAKDLQRYMNHLNLLYLENETAEAFCLNPKSGELIKGMMICLAEMGLVDYHAYATRKASTFKNTYRKEIRKKYLLHRLAFVQALFEKVALKEIVVYRGMTSEKPFQVMKRPIISTTLSLSTAKEFFDESNDKNIKSSYLLKLTIPISQILMTYIETQHFNQQYLEQEVIMLNTNRIPL